MRFNYMNHMKSIMVIPLNIIISINITLKSIQWKESTNIFKIQFCFDSILETKFLKYLTHLHQYIKIKMNLV